MPRAAPSIPVWARRWAGHPLAPAALALLAAAEAALFPAPVEVLLIALTLLRPRPWRLVGLAVAASTLGALGAYAVGHATLGSVGAGLAGSDRIAEAAALYRRGAFAVLATSGFTQIPYVAYTVAAGAAGVPLGSFVLGAAAGRFLKYAAVAAVAVMPRFAARWWRQGAPPPG